MASIVLYVSSRENFFVKPRRVNCHWSEYCIYEGVGNWPEVELSEQRPLMDIGNGISVSEPVYLECGLKSDGQFFYANISHDGIIAIYSYTDDKILQLSDLKGSAQVNIDVERRTMAGFYDDRIIFLTYEHPLRECLVREIFSHPTTSVLKKIGTVDDAYTFADVYLLNETRNLYYRTNDYKAWEYNVDTRRNRELKLGRLVNSFASTMGLDLGVRAIFQERGNGNLVYALNEDYTTSLIYEYPQPNFLTKVFQSSSNQFNIERSLKLFWQSFFYLDDTKIGTRCPFSVDPCMGMIRIYRNTFLVLDASCGLWCVVRIVVP